MVELIVLRWLGVWLGVLYYVGGWMIEEAIETSSGVCQATSANMTRRSHDSVLNTDMHRC